MVQARLWETHTDGHDAVSASSQDVRSARKSVVMTEAALSDLRVIEYAQGIPGPFCAKALADLGADVLKIEPPEGDRSRLHGPFANDEPHPERSGRFLYLNTNKRGVTLSLEAAQGRALFRELIADVDLLICDLPPRRYPELEMDYARLHALNRGLVMVCISPYGLTGPYRDYKGSAFTGFHVGGVGRETPANEITDPEVQPPLSDGGFQADYLTGWTAATMAMIAVFQRSVSGSGQLLDVATMEAVAAMTRMPVAMIGYGLEPKLTREKTNFPWVLPCKDGYVSFAPFLLDHWWAAFVEMMGRPDWAVSEVFATTMGRVQNADAVEPLTVEWLMRHTKQEIYEMALERNVACFPVNSIREVLDSRQYAAREFLITVDHPAAGPVTQPGAPGAYSGTPWAVRRPAPLLGEHNGEVLGGLGYSADELAAFAAQGVT